uniref:Uncharacterized protein n=1 Tax=Oryza rufipogon TaxID=4529 RepID=A0A0E0QC16_ORYRU
MISSLRGTKCTLPFLKLRVRFLLKEYTEFCMYKA